MPYTPLAIDQSDVRYTHGPDSVARGGVPVGTTAEFDWTDSVIYPGTTRKFWVHIPARYDPAELAGLRVFQDGQRYLDADGEVHGAIVLDDLKQPGGAPHRRPG